MAVNQRSLFLTATVVLCCTVILLGGPTPITAHVATQIKKYSSLNDLYATYLPSGPSEEPEQNRYAYMTLLTGTMLNPSDPNINNDIYYVATRLLGWQLLHAPATKTQHNIPFVIMVTTKVPQAMVTRLEKDGHIVILVQDIEIAPEIRESWMPRWRDLMTKLRGWEQVQYEKVLFLDGDTILMRSLDGVFTDPGSNLTVVNASIATPTDESAPGDEYLFASIPEAAYPHNYPPSAANGDFNDPSYFCAGFFLFAPSLAQYQHYLSILHIPSRFDMSFVEQNLLNYAHRQEGRIPWQKLSIEWNVRWPYQKDVDLGVASVHDKWWAPENGVNADTLGVRYNALKAEMDAFYELMDASDGDSESGRVTSKVSS